MREYERLEVVNRQIGQLKAERAHLLKTSNSSDVEKVRQLLHLRGIGSNSAWLYVMEFFWLARVSKPKADRRLGGFDTDALSEWRSGPGTRHQQIR